MQQQQWQDKACHALKKRSPATLAIPPNPKRGQYEPQKKSSEQDDSGPPPLNHQFKPVIVGMVDILGSHRFWCFLKLIEWNKSAKAPTGWDES
jgi:hypothetical protein